MFVEALEAAQMKRFIPYISIEPMLKPAYKSVVIKIIQVEGTEKTVYVCADETHLITTEEQKAAAIESVTKALMVKVLKRCC